MSKWLAASGLLGCFLAASGERPPLVYPPLDEHAVTSGPHPALLVSEPLTLMALERRGLSFGRAMGAAGEACSDLARSPLYGSMIQVVERDLAEINERPT